jgi:hypothetical protein
MTLTELKANHPAIYALAEMRAKEQGNDLSKAEKLHVSCETFLWIDTPEGHNFWVEIDNGRFDHFYTLKHDWLIEEIRKGKYAILNDDNIEATRSVIKYVWPNDIRSPSTLIKILYYYQDPDNKSMWCSRHETTLPVIPANYLIKKEASEWVPKSGDVVLATNYDIDYPLSMEWDKATFLLKHEDWFICQRPQLSFPMGFKHCHPVPIPAKVKVTLAEIAEWKGCKVEDLEITPPQGEQ